MTDGLGSIARRTARDTGGAPDVPERPDYEPLAPSEPRRAAARSRLATRRRDPARAGSRQMIRAVAAAGRPLHARPVPDRCRRRLRRRAAARSSDPIPSRPGPMRERRARSTPTTSGLFLLEPTKLQLRFALPNKLFEFVQARLRWRSDPRRDGARGPPSTAWDRSPTTSAPRRCPGPGRARRRGRQLRFGEGRRDSAARVLSSDAARETSRGSSAASPRRANEMCGIARELAAPGAPSTRRRWPWRRSGWRIVGPDDFAYLGCAMATRSTRPGRRERWPARRASASRTTPVVLDLSPSARPAMSDDAGDRCAAMRFLQADL